MATNKDKVGWPKPYALEWDEWDQWDSQTRAKYPVRYFLRETIPDYWRRLRQIIHDSRWWVLHRFHPNHRYHVVNTGLPPGYHDPGDRAMHAAFASFEAFYRHWGWAGDAKAYADAHVKDVDDGPNRDAIWKERHDFAADVEMLHQWWTVTRPNRKDPYEDADVEDDWRARLAIEDAYLAEDVAMFIKLAKHVHALWL